MTTGERLKEFRERYGMSFRAMRAFGINENSVRRWENGFEPKPENKERIEKVLEMTEKEVNDAIARANEKRKNLIDTKPCRGCVYFSKETQTCDYILMTKKRRPCPPGMLCKAKKIIRGRNGKAKTDRNAIIRDLYKAGKNDREIAAETGFSAGAVFKWRCRHRLKPNYNGGRPKKEDGNADRK